MICKFWWCNQDKENKVHWISWDNLMKRKRDGGLVSMNYYRFYEVDIGDMTQGITQRR